MNTLENYRQNLEKLQDTVINLSWSSESFKKNVLTNPIEFLKQYGAPIPEGINIIVKETEKSVPVSIEGTTVSLHIPQKPDFQDIQLSDKELEVVSGGVAEAGISSAICSYSVCGPITINF